MKASAFCQRYQELEHLNLSRERLVEELTLLPFPADPGDGEGGYNTFDDFVYMCTPQWP